MARRLLPAGRHLSHFPPSTLSPGGLGRPPSPSADGCCTRAHAPNDGHLADRSQVFARARRRRGPRAQWRARLARTPLPSPTPRAPPQVGRQQKRVAGAGSGGCRALDPLSQACAGCRPSTVGPEPPDPGKALEAGPSAASAPGPLSECSLHQAPEALDPSPREAHRLLVQILFPFPCPSPSTSPPHPQSLCTSGNCSSSPLSPHILHLYPRNCDAGYQLLSISHSQLSVTPPTHQGDRHK